jgi:CRISPR type IV-associated protein Csf1
MQAKDISPTEIIWRAHGCPAVAGQEDRREICCLCGLEHAQNCPATKYIKATFTTFTNRDLLKAPLSKWICPACAFTLSEAKFRRTSFVCTPTEFISLKRDDIAKWLFNPPETPFIFCITTSYKKHLAIHAEVNYSRDRFQVVLDEMQIWFEPERWRQMFEALETMYSVFTKEEIRTGRYEFRRVAQCDPERFERFESILAVARGYPEFELLLLAANRKEELACQIKRSQPKSSKETPSRLKFPKNAGQQLLF